MCEEQQPGMDSVSLGVSFNGLMDLLNFWTIRSFGRAFSGQSESNHLRGGSLSHPQLGDVLAASAKADSCRAKDCKGGTLP